MIERYTRPEMGAIWSEAGKHHRLREVEIDRAFSPEESLRHVDAIFERSLAS